VAVISLEDRNEDQRTKYATGGLIKQTQFWKISLTNDTQKLAGAVQCLSQFMHSGNARSGH
jgi:hypothetical protein